MQKSYLRKVNVSVAQRMKWNDFLGSRGFSSNRLLLWSEGHIMRGKESFCDGISKLPFYSALSNLMHKEAHFLYFSKAYSLYLEKVVQQTSASALSLTRGICKTCDSPIIRQEEFPHWCSLAVFRGVIRMGRGIHGIRCIEKSASDTAGSRLSCCYFSEKRICQSQEGRLKKD